MDATMMESAAAIKPRCPVNAFLRHRCEAAHMDSPHLELYTHGFSLFVGGIHAFWIQVA